MTTDPLTDDQLAELKDLISRTTPVGAVTASPGLLGMLVGEVERLRPPAVSPLPDQTLRDRIALAIHSELTEYQLGRDTGLIVQRLTDAALRELPPPADRAAVLLEAADAITAVIEKDRAQFPRRSNDRAALGGARQIVLDLIDKPRRSADEAPQPAACGAREPEPRTGTSPCVLPAGHGGDRHQDKWTNQWPVAKRQPAADGSGEEAGA